MMSDLEQPTVTPKNELATGKTQVLNLDYKVAALLAYVPLWPLNLIASIILVATEPKSNYYLQFHARQSLVLCAGGIALTIVNFILSSIPVINLLMIPVALIVMPLVSLAFIGVSIYLMIESWKGKVTRLPVVGELVDKWMARS